MTTHADPPVMILCGGKGTRLREHTQAIPKGLVEVGGRPILWHIMKTYAHYGFDRFILCLGYKGESIREYFGGTAKPRRRGSDPTAIYREGGDRWKITFADTGLETNTGGRLKRAAAHVSAPVVFATYGDGLANLDLHDLRGFHEKKGRLATLTCVRPRSPFGIVVLDPEDRAVAFREKPPMEQWINGGFFVFQREVLDNYLRDDDILERAPFERLAKEGQFSAYRFGGFWQCMDTYKDSQELNELWRTGEPPWKVW